MTTAGHAVRAELDSQSRGLLARLQAHIPLVQRPFLALGEELEMPEAEVIRRTQAMIEARLIRQVGPIFDGRALGYESCLVAAKYDPERLAAGAHVISSYPGVSHNYRRDHDFNLWYTIAVPPGHSLAADVELLHRLSGAESTRLLPAVRMFKLGVKLEMEETPADSRSAPPVATGHATGPGPHLPSEIEVAAVRAFQELFMVTATPFEEPAALHGFASSAALLAVGNALLEHGLMRRFSAVLRHREAGFGANGMVVWEASDEECMRAGPIMATFAKVSHCYQRPAYDDWPYSLFTMIHGRATEEVDECIDALRRATGLEAHRVLYSTTEFKKARVRYFTHEWDDWRREARAAGARDRRGTVTPPRFTVANDGASPAGGSRSKSGEESWQR